MESREQKHFKSIENLWEDEVKLKKKTFWSWGEIWLTFGDVQGFIASRVWALV